jgi:hypothetical protein
MSSCNGGASSIVGALQDFFAERTASAGRSAEASGSNSSQDGLLHDLERKPKKTQTAKKDQIYIQQSKNIQLHAG